MPDGQVADPRLRLARLLASEPFHESTRRAATICVSAALVTLAVCVFGVKANTVAIFGVGLEGAKLATVQLVAFLATAVSLLRYILRVALDSVALYVDVRSAEPRPLVVEDSEELAKWVQRATASPRGVALAKYLGGVRAVLEVVSVTSLGIYAFAEGLISVIE